MKILNLLPMLLFSCYVMACSCFFTPMSGAKIMESEFTIEGKIIAKEKIDYNYEYTIQVNDLIKGKIFQKTITVTSPISGAACGVNFRMNENYYLFMYRYKGQYNTNLCSDNRMKSSVSKRYKNIIRQFKKDKKNLEWKDEQCQLVGKGKITNKSAVGNWKFYHPDNTIKSEGSYQNGKRAGEWKEYYSKEGSANLWERLTEKQKATVKNRDNILTAILTYKDGRIENRKRLFE